MSWKKKYIKSFQGTQPPYMNSIEVFRNNGSFKIDRAIQTWIDKNSSQDIRPHVSSLKKRTNPNYVYMFWTDETALTFVEVMFPNILPLFSNYPRNLQRADVIQYVILYEYGGVDADLDIKFEYRFDGGGNIRFAQNNILPLAGHVLEQKNEERTCTVKIPISSWYTTPHNFRRKNMS
ncbi:hypothetical protein CHS0354_012600 [Potamilus streckersoni]|uniref:Uncharacterized protein n=1 Tax=Potamilus streckersoni TaxID=2493646 RepID=A0AAE0W3Q5_9BIVA|nr:hypothetical protein CHS0354_012600 [Potamilus streckersoni]